MPLLVKYIAAGCRVSPSVFYTLKHYSRLAAPCASLLSRDWFLSALTVAAWHPPVARRQPRAGRAMVTLTSLLTSSPLHVLLVEVFTRYLKNYGEWLAISRVCLLCVGLG